MYYMLAADAGIEVGNFNLAMLCEENYVSMQSMQEFPLKGTQISFFTIIKVKYR